MGTLVGSIAEWLVGGNAFDPHVINLVRNQWHGGVGFQLEVIPESQLVRGRHWEVEQFKKSVDLIDQSANGNSTYYHTDQLASATPCITNYIDK
uniref:Uncharacterized protein n=1 Tax=Romanomermis culicivorax TaxID=13658 RepID=A0A915HSF1_ROMCU